MSQNSYLTGDNVVIARIKHDLRPHQVVEHALEVAASGPRAVAGGGGDPPDPSDPLPPGPADNHGFAIVSSVTEQDVPHLRQIVTLLEQRIRQPDPLLVAITEDDTAARTVADTFASTLLVQPNNRARIDDLLPFLPGLVENTAQLGTIGSVRLPRPIDVSDVKRRDADFIQELTGRKGVSLHRVANEPYCQYYSFAAPPQFHDPIRETLDAVHLASHGTSDAVVQLARFVFESDPSPTAVELGDPAPPDDDHTERVVSPAPPRPEGGEASPGGEDD